MWLYYCLSESNLMTNSNLANLTTTFLVKYIKQILRSPWKKYWEFLKYKYSISNVLRLFLSNNGLKKLEHIVENLVIRSKIFSRLKNTSMSLAICCILLSQSRIFITFLIWMYRSNCRIMNKTPTSIENFLINWRTYFPSH